MPKLKKHSQIKTRQIEETTEKEDKYDEETKEEEMSHGSPMQKQIRMKYSDRVKDFERSKSKRKSKKIKKQSNQQDKVPANSVETKEDSNMNIFLNKYTDDDDIDEIEEFRQPGRRKSQKLLKPEIKTKNKMFSNLQFDGDAEQQKLEHYQQLDISIEKRGKRESGQFLEKFQSKAQTLKNKLEYKDLNKDHKYQRSIQDKLKQIKEVEEVNIQIEAPKVFNGNRPQVEAALFLKNTKESTQEIQDNVNTQKQDEELSTIVDRKLYYEQLGKKLRMKNTETFTQNILKERFKKSMLNEEDYIDDLDDKTGDNYQRRQSDYSRRPIVKTKSQEHSLEGKSVDASNRQSNRLFKAESMDSNIRTQNLKKSRINSKQSIQEQSISLVDNKASKKTGKEDKISEPADLNPITYKKKTQSQNIKKKIKTFKYNNLIEVEAEQSDDQQDGGPRHKDELQSDEEGSDEVDSLIDDNTQIGHNDRHILQRKFMADMIEEEQRKYNEMRKKIEKKYLEEQEMIRKRMEEAAKKNMERDRKEDVLYYADKVLDENSASAATSKSTTMKGQDQDKLKQLEQMLNNDKKKKPIQANKLGNASGINALQALGKSIFGGKAKSQKIQRQGMKNANVHKKPITIKGKK